LISEKGDLTPIFWLHRSERFAEKLATPDVTVADIIGDVDPIKAANLKLSYADDRVIHYGMIPQFVFTANPEDYTNRGSIITPLKDRIGSQILTHYPETVAIAKIITKQEAKLGESQKNNIYIPELARDIIEQVAFEARKSEYVDIKSGVSARFSITAFENLLSTAELRMLTSGEEKTSIRLGDFIGVIPAINGKIELVYEGEQEGAASVAQLLIQNSIKTLFTEYFPKIEKLEHKDATTPYDEVVAWFFDGTGFELPFNMETSAYKQQLEMVPSLDALIDKYQPDTKSEDRYFLKEFILWGLVEFKKLSKEQLDNGFQFKDVFRNYIDRI